jgi:hypothetical protein
MFYAALSLWLALKFWAKYDPDPALHPNAPRMSASEFNMWYAL